MRDADAEALETIQLLEEVTTGTKLEALVAKIAILVVSFEFDQATLAPQCQRLTPRDAQRHESNSR